MKLVLLLFLVFPRLLSGQYFFDFESDSPGEPPECPTGRWVQIPNERWSCSTDDPLSGHRSLHHTYDNPGPGCDYILFTHDAPVTDSAFGCSFRVRHGYPPSSANNWQVALLAKLSGNPPVTKATDVRGLTSGAVEVKGTADQEAWEWISEGLILGVNLTGSDDRLTLWQCEQGNLHVICTTSVNYQEEAGPEGAPLISLEVNRDGVVSVYYANDPESETFLAGRGQLNNIPAGRQLSFRFQYSSAQDRMLWIDDLSLSGYFCKDVSPPRLESAEVMDGLHVKLDFSEPLKQFDCFSCRLEWPGGEWQEPDSCWMEGEEQVMVKLAEVLPNREWMKMEVTGVCDLDGNCLVDTSFALRRCEAVWGDLVFSEVMADPAPQVRLPDLEYTELYNRSGEQFDLTGWQLVVNGRIYRLSEQHADSGLRISPGGYLLVTGINLPNEGGELILLTENDMVVHAATFGIPWQGPDWKREGGWSLESPDPDRICGISALWGYSEDPSGGTPGRLNSLDARIEDVEPPALLYSGFRYNQAVFSLYFSEPVRYSYWVPSHFPISPGNLFPEWVEASFPLSDRIDLGLPEGMTDGGTFSVSIPFLVDCSGNITRNRKAPGGFPHPPTHGSVVINEVMYAPEDGTPEYIELYHAGQFFCDLIDLGIAITKEGDAGWNPVPVSSVSRLMAPGTYLVLTRNVNQFIDAYSLDPSGRWVEMNTWKTLDNGGGIITLTDRAGQALDRVPFSDQMHMELLGDTRGISLERMDPFQPGDRKDNWHSAASIAGYATPGEPNSQQAGTGLAGDILEVRPKVFSPDNDGWEDLLEITLSPGGHGWAIHLMITDLEGRKVRTLANNDLAGTMSVYRWDGESDHRHMVPEGIYLLHARGYQPSSGKSWRRRMSVGVIYR